MAKYSQGIKIIYCFQILTEFINIICLIKKAYSFLLPFSFRNWTIADFVFSMGKVFLRVLIEPSKSFQFNIFQEPEEGHPEDDDACLDLGPPKRPRVDEESHFLHFGSLREAESYIDRTGQAQGVSFRKRKVPKNFGNSG